MIQEFVDKLMANEAALRAGFAENKPVSYADLVARVVSVLHDGNRSPDPNRIHEIDDGDYQGTLLYVIADGSYQPSTYWAVSVDYGSCSGCDTLEAICDDYRSAGYGSPLNDEGVRQVWQLAVNIVQGLRLITGDAS